MQVELSFTGTKENLGTLKVEKESILALWKKLLSQVKGKLQLIKIHYSTKLGVKQLKKERS